MKEIVVFSTAGSADEAEQIAAALVEHNLAACCNIIPLVRSIYRWAGEIRREEETLLVIKSIEEKLPELIGMVKRLHSYQVPEIISLPVAGGSEDYIGWMRGVLGAAGA